MLEVFEEIPIDQFLEKRKEKLPDMPEKVKKKLLQDAKFFAEQGLPIDITTDITTASFGISNEMQSAAYPNYDYATYVAPPADTRKWLDAVKTIYYLVHKGEERGSAMMKVIGSWKENEKRSFIYWLRFYEEGDHNKYKAGSPIKVAQLQFFNDIGQQGYYFPNQAPAQVFDQAKTPNTHPEVVEDDRREKIETQRNKILSRLDSAEKLLRSEEGNMFARHDLEHILNDIYQLKNKIHNVNKRTVSTRLYEDMIVRQANIFTKKGFIKAASILHKIADDVALTPPEANNPLQMGGIPGDISGAGIGPGMTPMNNATNSDPMALTDPTGQAPQTSQVGSPTALPLPPPASGQTQSSPQPNADTEPGISPGMKDFLRGLDEGKDTYEEKDELISPASLALGLQYQAALIIESHLNRAMLVSEAQQAAPPADVVEETPDPGIKADKDFDKILDSAFQQLTVSDVVARLEDLTKVFKVREIPRQLSIVDMMLDRLGLASFFPNLGECVQKSHESNNYISTRVEDILSRLRGTLATNNIDLAGDKQAPITPDVEIAQEKLRLEQEKEEARKKMRKDLANKELDNKTNKPVPDLEVAEDLKNPPPPLPPAGPTPQPENLRLNRPR